MSAYTIQVQEINQLSPTLKKGKIRISATVPIYWTVGENPIASKHHSALLPVGKILELNLPVKCSKIAVLAARDFGTVSITELSGGASSSCSA